MDDFILPAVAGVAAALGFAVHVVIARFWKKAPEPTVQVTTGPASYTITPDTGVIERASAAAIGIEGTVHDWHIRGKTEGKVIQYCLSCGAERERP